MKKLVIVILLVVLLVVPAACGQSAPTTNQDGITSPGVAPAPQNPNESKGGSGGFTAPPALPPGPSTSDSSAVSDPLIVRTAQISLVVEDVSRSVDTIASLAKANGGFVVTSGVFHNGERLFGNISIRVAVESFDATIQALRQMAVEVTSETTSSKDVTEEYVDLQAKLRNLQATEQQLLRLMEKAEKVEDILAIQRELTQVRGEIEQTQGRIQFLERTSSTSLIDISLQESKLSVKFTASTSSVKTGEAIRFNPEINGGFAPYSYAWDFGDGRTSTDQSPFHAYDSQGKYTVTFKLIDDKGNTAELTRKDYVAVTSSWAPGNIARGAWTALASFGRGLVNVIIVLGIWLPVWIVIGAIIYWFIWRRKKKAAR